MTLVNIDLRNQGYETGPDDRVIFYSLLVREGDFGTISTAPVEVELVDGKASVDLAPGPVGVQIIARQVADTRIKIGEVPPSGPTTLNAVMMVTPAYTPALQQMMIAAIERAKKVALDQVDGAVSVAIDAEVGEAIYTATSSAVSAANSAAASQHSAASANARAISAEVKVNAYTPRVDALEVMGGLAPGEPIDGQTANLVAQQETLTRSAVGNAARDSMDVISVTQFGAVGDGVTDDRAAIQAAIDYVIAKGAGTLYFPPVPSHYSIRSAHPSDPTVALKLDATALVGSQWQRGSIKIQGAFARSIVKLETPAPITSLFSMPVRTNYMVFESVNFDANQKADYAMRADEAYHPYINMIGSRFSGGLVSSLSLASFVGHLDRCEFSRSAQDGLTLKGVGGNVVTSMTLTSCYAVDNARYGFNFGFVTYCTLNACAGDHNDLTYKFSNAYGVVMNGCGSEFSRRALKVDAFRRFILNGMYGLGMGAKVSEGQVPDSLIEFVAGMDATVAGVYFNNPETYTKVLTLTGSSYGRENVTILDDSIGRNEASFVTNYRFSTRPIKFLRGDESTRDTTWTVDTTLTASNPNSLSSILRDISHMEINHTYTINLSDGIEPDASAKLLENVRGSGTLIIQGNAADNTAVRIQGAHRALHLMNVGVRVIFRNLTIDQRENSGSAHLLRLTNAGKVVLDNVRLFSLAANAGAAIHARESSRAILINGTRASGGTFNQANLFLGPFDWDRSSSIDMEDMASPPTDGVWSKGMVVHNSAPEPGSYMGWVRTASSWKPYGFISE